MRNCSLFDSSLASCTVLTIPKDFTLPFSFSLTLYRGFPIDPLYTIPTSPKLFFGRTRARCFALLKSVGGSGPSSKALSCFFKTLILPFSRLIESWRGCNFCNFLGTAISVLLLYALYKVKTEIKGQKFRE